MREMVSGGDVGRGCICAGDLVRHRLGRAIGRVTTVWVQHFEDAFGRPCTEFRCSVRWVRSGREQHHILLEMFEPVDVVTALGSLDPQLGED